MHRFFFSMWLLTAFTLAVADEPQIVGPNTVSAPGIKARLYLEGVDPLASVGWDVLPKIDGLDVIDEAPDERSATIFAPGGAWNIVVSIHAPGEKPRNLYYAFTVPGAPYVPPPGPPPTPPLPGPNPPPSPGPGPAPAPTPTPIPDPGPPNVFDYRAKVAATVNTVRSPARAAEALCLAGKLLALRERIGKEITTAQPIVQAIGAALDECTAEPWDAAREQLTTALGELLNAKRLQTIADWKQLIHEAEFGLRDAAR